MMIMMMMKKKLSQFLPTVSVAVNSAYDDDNEALTILHNPSDGFCIAFDFIFALNISSLESLESVLSSDSG